MVYALPRLIQLCGVKILIFTVQSRPLIWNLMEGGNGEFRIFI